MIQAVMIATACMGQLYADPFCPQIYTPVVCPQPIYTVSTPTPVPTNRTYLVLDGMVEEHRVYDKIQYGDIWRRVPVINGYAPAVYETRLVDGSWKITYDYSKRTEYSECVTWREAQRAAQRTRQNRVPYTEPPAKKFDITVEEDTRPGAPREALEPVSPAKPPRAVPQAPAPPAGTKRPSDVVEPERPVAPDYGKGQ